MLTPEEYRAQLEKELDDFAVDEELMNSPLWERWNIIFNLRREMLMSMNMRNEDDSVGITSRLKGRFQETEDWIAHANALRTGDAETRSKLLELDEYEKEAQLEEQEGGL